MIPLINARRTFLPAAIPAFVVTQVDSGSAGSSTGLTSSNVAIGAAGATRQYWLVISGATNGASSTPPSWSATLGGNAFTLRRAYQLQAVAGYYMSNTFMSLDGYTTDTVADLVLTVGSAENHVYCYALLKVSDAVDATVAVDTGATNVNSGGTYPHTISVPDRGLVLGSGTSDATGGQMTINGLDNTPYQNVTLGHGRTRFAIGWHASELAEDLACSFVFGSSTADKHLGIIDSFGPAP